MARLSNSRVQGRLSGVLWTTGVVFGRWQDNELYCLVEVTGSATLGSFLQEKGM